MSLASTPESNGLPSFFWHSFRVGDADAQKLEYVTWRPDYIVAYFIRKLVKRINAFLQLNSNSWQLLHINHHCSLSPLTFQLFSCDFLGLFFFFCNSYTKCCITYKCWNLKDDVMNYSLTLSIIV